MPYRGGGQVMTDLIAGRLSYVFATLPTALPFIGEGRLRALGDDRTDPQRGLAGRADRWRNRAAQFLALRLARAVRARRRSRSRLSLSSTSPRSQRCSIRKPPSGSAPSVSKPRAARRRTSARISIASSSDGRTSPAT